MHFGGAGTPFLKGATLLPMPHSPLKEQCIFKGVGGVGSHLLLKGQQPSAGHSPFLKGQCIFFAVWAHTLLEG